MATRSGRLSHAQLETLVRYLEANPELARGRPKTIKGNQQNKVQWFELAKKLNAIKGAPKKTSRAWAKCWADKKCQLKKALTKYNRSVMEGKPGDEHVSPLDFRLISILNDEDATEGKPIHVKQEQVYECHNEPPVVEPPSPRSECSSPSVADEEPEPDTPSPKPKRAKRAESLKYPKRTPKWCQKPLQLQTEWNRLALLEEKRVRAENSVAKAQRESSAAMVQCATALEVLAKAIKSQGAEIADALRANGEMIAEALQAQGKMIADALRKNT